MPFLLNDTAILGVGVWGGGGGGRRGGWEWVYGKGRGGRVGAYGGGGGGVWGGKRWEGGGVWGGGGEEVGGCGRMGGGKRWEGVGVWGVLGLPPLCSFSSLPLLGLPIERHVVDAPSFPGLSTSMAWNKTLVSWKTTLCASV